MIRRPRPTLFCRVAAGPLLLVCLGGCAPEDLDTHYGSRQSIFQGDSSVNGLGVLSEMFSRAGHKVGSVRRLTPRLARSADVIVWFPNDFAAPSTAAVDWLEEWLEDGDGRTLIFVTRDYDAEEHYWAKVKGQATPAELPQVNSRQFLAKTLFAGLRAPTLPQPEDWTWFKMDRSATLTPRSIRSLSGDPNWTADVDATQAEIELYGAIQPRSSEDEILLQSGKDVIAFRRRYTGYSGAFGSGVNPLELNGDLQPLRRLLQDQSQANQSQLIVVANGSFLLNMPLVNKEHRKLAGSLIREVGDKKVVYFLEAGGSPQVLLEDPPPLRLMVSTMYFNVPRIQNLLWHLSVLTLIVCFALFAIFGRPRWEQKTFDSDFGQHVKALGDLLEKTRDATYARQRVAQYQTLADHAGRRRKP